MAHWERMPVVGLPVGTVVRKEGHQIGGTVNTTGLVAWMDEDPRVMEPELLQESGEVEALIRDPQDTDAQFVLYLEGYLMALLQRPIGVWEFITTMDKMAS